MRQLAIYLYALSVLFNLPAPLFAQDSVSNPLWQPWYISPRSAQQHIDLSGAWELSYTDRPVDTLSALAGVTNTFSTTVPNSVHWSLYNAGKLPHPYYNKNSDQYKWVDEKVWYYRKQVNVPATAKNNLVFLCFDGLDYFSKVWLNGHWLGDHEGMFGGPSVEVSKYIRYGSDNEITVEIRAGNWGNKATDYESFPRNPSGSRDFSRRNGFNPRSSGRIIKPWLISGGSGGEMFFSVGMWQGARLEIVPEMHLERPYLVTQEITGSNARLHLSLEVFFNAHSLQQQLHPWNNVQIRHPDEKGVPFVPVPGRSEVQVSFKDASGTVFRQTFPLALSEGRNWLEKDLLLQNIKNWNPSGLGQPHLYDVTVSLFREGRLADELQFHFGIRTIGRMPTAGPRTGDRFQDWQFVVNGKKIFVKGMNFTPQDILLETGEERCRWTLQAAKDMGVQLIRVWGGGLLETDLFYRLCDEMGIMVWQDFTIGNQDTPLYPQDVWEAQVVQNICRLRNHASLVQWCGGNEFNPYSYDNAASMGILERNLQIFDKSRVFVRTSPDDGSVHVYPDMDPTWYNKSYRYEPWVAETGIHSIPDAGRFKTLIKPEEMYDLGKMWQADFGEKHPELVHHFAEYGIARVPRMLSRASHISDLNGNPSIESIAEASQIGAAEFYQLVSEKVQGNYPVTAGLMPWVFKRHWPVIAIQLMDWFGQPSAPYYFLKRTYEPCHVALDIDRLLWAPGETMALPVKITSAPGTIAGNYTVTVTVYDDHFIPVHRFNGPVSIKSGTSVSTANTGQYRIPATYRDRFLFVLTELKNARDSLLSRSFYFPRSLDTMSNKSYYDAYLKQPVPWITLDKGPWLKPAVSRTSTTLDIRQVAVRKGANGQASVSVSVKNTGSIPAFMTTIEIKGTTSAWVASDNFFWLAPGEQKQVDIRVQEESTLKNAAIIWRAWNAPPVEKLLP